MKDLDKPLDKNSVFTFRQAKILEEVAHERIKQEAEWGIQSHNEYKWFMILMEEIGEIANAINELYPAGKMKYTKKNIKENLKYELIQTMAVCLAWLEHYSRLTQRKG